MPNPPIPQIHNLHTYSAGVKGNGHLNVDPTTCNMQMENAVLDRTNTVCMYMLSVNIVDVYIS